MEANNFFELNIPTKNEELLKKVINSKVRGMVRYGLEPKENFSKEYGVDNEAKAFSLSEGALVMDFENGISLGFSSSDEIWSVLIWAEQYYGQYRKNQLKDATDLFPINATDKRYSTNFFSNIINQTLVRYEIIKQEPYHEKFCNLPREVGVVLEFSNKSQMIISHQLTKEVSDDFTILEWEQIDKEIYPMLYKTSQFWT